MGDMEPNISVKIPSFSRKSWLIQTLRGLLQTFLTFWKIGSKLFESLLEKNWERHVDVLRQIEI